MSQRVFRASMTATPGVSPSSSARSTLMPTVCSWFMAPSGHGSWAWSSRSGYCSARAEGMYERATFSGSFSPVLRGAALLQGGAGVVLLPLVAEVAPFAAPALLAYEVAATCATASSCPSFAARLGKHLDQLPDGEEALLLTTPAGRPPTGSAIRTRASLPATTPGRSPVATNRWPKQRTLGSAGTITSLGNVAGTTTTAVSP